MVDNLFFIAMVIVGTLVFAFLAYLFQKIPGASYIFKLFKFIFIILACVFFVVIRFIMFFLAGYIAYIVMSFTEEPALYNGEQMGVLYNNEGGAQFVLAYSVFCVIAYFAVIFLYSISTNLLKRKQLFFEEEVIFLLIAGSIYFIFPGVLHSFMPEITMTKLSTYLFTIVPIWLYIEGRIKKAKQGPRNSRYQSNKDRFYLDVEKRMNSKDNKAT